MAIKLCDFIMQVHYLGKGKGVPAGCHASGDWFMGVVLTPLYGQRAIIL